MAEPMRRGGPKRHRVYLWARRSRFVLLLIILIIGIAAYVIGLNMSYRQVASLTQLNQQLQTEGQKLKKQLADQSASSATVQAKLAALKSAMDAMKPAENTYNLKPNQSVAVGDGRLTIGLVGSPTNEGININVNGKHQFAATGDVIKVAPDASTSCQVTIQSFDPFGAAVTAACAAAKP